MGKGRRNRKIQEVVTMRYERNHHVDVIRTLAKDRGWSKHKVKSIRGQILSMNTFEERERYLKKLIAAGQ